MPGKRKATKKPQEGLNPKQIAFAICYAANGGNGTEAAKQAGYSDRGAAQQAHVLLRNPKIQALIGQEQANRWRRLQMSGDEVLARTAQLARANIKEVVNERGVILSPAAMDEWTAYGVASFEARLQFQQDGAPPEEFVKVKMRDPVPSLRLLAQNLKLIGSDVTVNLTEELADRLAKARKRAREARQ